MAFNVVKNNQNANIKIPDSCILEVYKDNISASNSLGYSILPLSNVEDVEAAITNRVNEIRPLGYSKLAILAGQNNILFNHCIVYCVFYNGAVAPTYPDIPLVERLPEPTNILNIWDEFIIINNGAKNTNAEIILNTINNNDKYIEFYINNDYYLVKYNGSEGEIIINNTGVYFNNIPTDQFNMNYLPILQSGENHIKIKKTNVNKIQVNYIPLY